MLAENQRTAKRTGSAAQLPTLEVTRVTSAVASRMLAEKFAKGNGMVASDTANNASNTLRMQSLKSVAAWSSQIQRTKEKHQRKLC